MSSPNNIARREQVQAALKSFADKPLAQAATQLLAALGYASEKTADLGNSAETFLGNIEQFKPELGAINRDKIKADRWKSCAFLFQLTNDEIPSLLIPRDSSLSHRERVGVREVGGEGIARSQIESFVFLAIELKDEQWSRTDLAAIARELNRRFPMPAIVLFKHGELLSLVVIDRRANLKDATRDVIDNRITVIKDVRIAAPHRAHLDILGALALENLGAKRRPSNFRELYDAWIAALSIQALNKRFYTELAWWYFWAVKQVTFPLGCGEDENRRNSVAVIRLLTRLIFSWFIKEKGLIPEALFDPNQLKTLLKSDPAANGEDSIYYHAILQNLFFASLNVEMGADRKWAADGGGMKGDRLIHSLYRHKEMFRDPDHVLSEYFSKIPFLNGGLFECLDRELTERDFQRNPELKELAVKEGSGWVLRVDGFSRRKDAQPIVPNKIFFGGEAQADLNADLDTKGKRFEVLGLIDIFGRYKFTVEENTPVEEEVALDPELLGKVFENLLASYNEDTQATARKQSGSFYTPREVVDYMVDEALIAYFERHLLPSPAGGRGAGGEGHGSPHKVNEVLNLGAGPGELNLSVIPAQAENQTPSPLAGQAATGQLAGVVDCLVVSPEGWGEGETAIKLRRLLSYTGEGNDFSPAETGKLIAAIESLKILDPACGSGAFPMGVLQKLVHVLKKLDPSNELWKKHNRAPLSAQLAEAKRIPDPSLRETKVEEAESALVKFDRDFANAKHADYTRKLYLIEKCIFGVDIQPIAVQIAKLRFFIALVVSQEMDKAKDNWGITALPNLETKIVAADSLTPIREVKSGMMENFQLGYDVVKGIEADLHDAGERYFSARTSKTKRKYREIIQDLRDKLASELEQSGFSTAKAQQLVHWNPFDQNAAADFFDPEWMFAIPPSPAPHPTPSPGRRGGFNGGGGEGYFDITIGNPPYVRQEEIKHLKDNFKAHYDCFTGTADLYVYFYERSIKLLKPGGAFAFITSNKWYRAKYGEKLRDWMNCNTQLRKIIDFGDESVFTAIAYPTIVIATRLPSPASGRGAGVRENMVRALNWQQAHPVEQFPAVFQAESFEVPQAELKKEGWQLEPPLKRQLLARIRAAGKPLGDYVNGRFYRGILTGFNEAFVIDGATRERLIAEDPKSAEIIKPFLRGRDVKRWRVEPQDLWLIFTRRPFDIESYPAIHKHLAQFREQLEPKPESWNDKNDGTWPGRKAGSYKWYEIQDNIAYWQEFEQPKIVFPDIALSPQFAWDEKKRFLGNTAYIIPRVERWLLAVLNSPVCAWFYAQISPQIQNGYYRFISQYCEQIPIPPSNSKAMSSLIVDHPPYPRRQT